MINTERTKKVRAPMSSDTKSPMTVLYARSPFKQHCNIPELLGCEMTDQGYIKIIRIVSGLLLLPINCLILQPF